LTEYLILAYSIGLVKYGRFGLPCILFLPGVERRRVKYGYHMGDLVTLCTKKGSYWILDQDKYHKVGKQQQHCEQHRILTTLSERHDRSRSEPINFPSL